MSLSTKKRKGFIVGKFLPFHRGHETLIKFALCHCDMLTVLVCCSDLEGVDFFKRKKWIASSFPKAKNLKIRGFNYRETQLPNTSVSDEHVSNIWSKELKKLLPDHEIIFSSEPYGDFVAKFMGIQHIPFDLNRTQVPISATQIKNDFFENWNFLPDAVKPDFIRKVVVLGTESTGKTTLVQQLSKHFRCTAVFEAGRALIADSKSFEFSDLKKVAVEHARSIEKAVIADSPLVVIDTDAHITKSYARFVFKKELPISEKIWKANHAHLYLYLNNDVPFFQDGTRLNEADRNLLDHSHREILSEHGIQLVEIAGNWRTRLDQAIASVASLL